MRSRFLVISVVFSVMALAACRKEAETATTATSATDTTASTSTAPATTGEPELRVQKVEATPEAVKKAQEELQTAADRDRRMRACLTFEDFEATVYKEPFEGGKYIVNGDTPIANVKQLREFFEKKVKQPAPTRLAVDQVSGMDNKWNQQAKKNLTYCVSTTFGSRHDAVVQQMENATAEWEKISAINFIHDASQDATCTPTNAAVVFDVRPVNVNGEYLARAFFPNEPRATRNVLIDETSFELTPGGKLQLVGILRHELGHTIGFRHEQTRPESGTCFEDKNWRPLTSYDAFSVMHYPQCNGKGDWSLLLTGKDKNGVACLYGPAAGFTIDNTLVASTTPCAAAEVVPLVAQAKTEPFAAQSVAKDKEKPYGPFAVTPGSPLEVVMGGAAATGDPDLYVRFAGAPKVNAFDCRPFTNGPAETCSLTVPTGASNAFVMVRGYAAGTYDLRVTHTGGNTP
jgi:serine protease